MRAITKLAVATQITKMMLFQSLVLSANANLMNQSLPNVDISFVKGVHCRIMPQIRTVSCAVKQQMESLTRQEILYNTLSRDPLLI